MQIYQNLLWGYKLQIPDDWKHTRQENADWFSPNRDNEETNYQGHLIIAAEWIYPPRGIEQLWQKHILSTAGKVEAKNIGSAPWRIDKASGYEAEIVLPKRENKRLWTGILLYGPLLLNMVVAHHLKERNTFEPLISEILLSLEFPEHFPETVLNPIGVPLPPAYQLSDVKEILSDINEGDIWYAYQGKETIGSLQAFYARELTAAGWFIQEFVSFPEQAKDIGFCRIRIQKEEKNCILGLMPYGEEILTSKSPANIVIKVL